jgi:predicted transcriptional regulator
MKKGMPPNPDSLRQRLLALLQDAGPMSTDEMAAHTSEDRKRVKHAVNSLLNDGLIRSAKQPVRYAPAAEVPGRLRPDPVMPDRPRGPFDI